MAKGPVEYVVVTRFRKKGRARPIVHVYGMYTQRQAKRLKQQMTAEAAAQGGGSFSAHCCHLINIEEMNHALAHS
jgi:hypothetical protein